MFVWDVVACIIVCSVHRSLCCWGCSINRGLSHITWEFASFQDWFDKSWPLRAFSPPTTAFFRTRRWKWAF